MCTHMLTHGRHPSLFRGKFALHKQKCFAPPPLTSHTHAHTPLHPSFCSPPSCTHSGQRATVCRCLTSVLSCLLYLFSPPLLPCEALLSKPLVWRHPPNAQTPVDDVEQVSSVCRLYFYEQRARGFLAKVHTCSVVSSPASLGQFCFLPVC